MSSVAEYIRHLGALEGMDFEKEVCSCLQSSILDFTRVVAKPHGDGGLDGLSHGQSRAYLCYGPEQEPFKKNTKGLKDDILKKFRGDLCTIFELTTDRDKLKNWETKELKTILAHGNKIESVFLIVSVFSDHRIIGPLNEYFNKCKKHSLCRYLEKSATIAIWGPEDVAAKGGVDDIALRRVEQQAFLSSLKQRVNSGEIDEPVPEDFEAKFDWLESQFPSKASIFSRLRKYFREKWLIALGLDQKFANSSVSTHESLENIRGEVVIDAEIKSAMNQDPMALLDGIRNLLNTKAKERFEGDLHFDVIDSIATGETARLIGECPIDWRQ